MIWRLKIDAEVGLMLLTVSLESAAIDSSTAMVRCERDISLAYCTDVDSYYMTILCVCRHGETSHSTLIAIRYIRTPY